jgi:hypothetical protein
MLITRRNPESLIENRLPDGSRLLVDSPNERVIALNTTAGAAWDACGAPTTVSGVAEGMRRSLGQAVSDEVVHEAVAQLQEKNLITSATPLPAASSRRAFIAKLGVAAVPLVVAMTMTEQRAYAGMTGSSNSLAGNQGGGPGGNQGDLPGKGIFPGGNKGDQHICGDLPFDKGCGKSGPPLFPEW